MPSDVPDVTLPRRWPLVGRDAMLAQVMQELDHRGALLAGAAGVGKSRLADEALQLAGRRGMAVQRFVATASAADIPLGALVEVIPRTSPGTGLALLQEVGDALQDRAAGRPLVVAVDDVHLLDPASATLIHHLVVAGRTRFLGTARWPARVPDAILALWKDEQVARIEVGPLTERDADALTAAVFGQASPIVRLKVREFSRGNPLLLRELVVDWVEAGVVRCHGTSWHWHGTAGVGPRLSDLVNAHLGRLDEADRDLLELLALGEPLALAVVEQVAAQASVAALERRGLLTVDPRGGRETRLAHPLYGELLRADLPVSRRPSLFRRLAETRTIGAAGRTGVHDRDERGTGPDYTLRHARWLLESDGPADRELFADAAGRALGRFDPVLAERLARAAQPGTDPATALVLCTALDLQDRLVEAAEVISPLVSDARDDIRAQAAVQLSRIRARDGSGADAATRALRRALSTTTDSYWSAVLRAELAELLLGVGILDESLALAVALSADSAADTRLRLRALWPAQGLLSMTGRQEQAVLQGDALAASIRTRSGWDEVESHALVSHGLALLYAGRLAAAHDLAAAGLDDAVTTGNWITHGLWAALLGWIALYRGQPRTATMHLTQTEILLRDLDPDRIRMLTLALGCQAAALTGDLAQASRLDTDARMADAVPRWFDHLSAAALAWRQVAGGELSRALGQILAAADEAARRGVPAIEMHVLHEALRLRGDRHIAERLVSVCSGQEGRWAMAFAQHAGAVLSGRGDDFLAAAAAFEEIGAMLHAAEAAAGGSAAFAAQGRQATARGAAVASRRWAARCEGAHTPMLQLADDPPGLTAREREITGLAARGMTNTEIAASLVVSVRTVEGHLYRAYTKLGISERADLAGIAGEVR